jgi:hypothetical protein
MLRHAIAVQAAHGGGVERDWKGMPVSAPPPAGTAAMAGPPGAQGGLSNETWMRGHQMQ